MLGPLKMAERLELQTNVSHEENQTKRVIGMNLVDCADRNKKVQNNLIT